MKTRYAHKICTRYAHIIYYLTHRRSFSHFGLIEDCCTSKPDDMNPGMINTGKCGRFDGVCCFCLSFDFDVVVSTSNTLSTKPAISLLNIFIASDIIDYDGVFLLYNGRKQRVLWCSVEDN